MNESKKLLILNLGIDSNDTSLGFTHTWINELKNEYPIIDVITMRLGKNDLGEDVGIYFVNKNNKKLTKFQQIKKIRYLFNEVLSKTNYDHCFAHMSPLLLVLGARKLRKKGIESTLWFTHPGPNYGVKRIVLYLAMLSAKKIVTASDNSFPYKTKKLNVIGHGIDFSRFEKREVDKIEKFLYLGRISESKKVHTIVENFLRFNEANQNNYSLTLIGGTLNNKDEKYLEKIKKIINGNQKIKLIGKVPHEKLGQVIKEFDCNINIANKGFFDKVVLETLYSGIINICYSDDYKQFYPVDQHDKLFIKNNLNEIEEKMNYVTKLYSSELKTIIQYSYDNLESHSLKTLSKRLDNIFR
tara:strand:- start:2222 stop:3289 length:1068 start_codon:yes stop_codon:yes gene_type:complete